MQFQKRKAFQICADDGRLFALCNDDTIWQFIPSGDTQKWRQLPELPQLRVEEEHDDYPKQSQAV
jgi:hypothetical protein